jgi:hypothetical protein
MDAKTRWDQILKTAIILFLMVVLAVVVLRVTNWMTRTDYPSMTRLFPEAVKAGEPFWPTSDLAGVSQAQLDKALGNAKEEEGEDINLSPGLPGTSTATEVFRSADALDYPGIESPDASRQIIFPDVPHGDRPALVAYESPFEDGDYCDNSPCGMDVPQYYYRVMTAGEVTIPDLGVSCIATPTKGCLVVVVNHFGPTAMYRGNTIDHGFTIAGRIWDMENPEDVSIVGQALLDHYAYRMTAVPDGANCSTIDACETLEWHLIVIGNGESQIHWSGLFRR